METYLTKTNIVIALVLVVGAGLVAANYTRLTQRAAYQCLDSQRLHFDDPESLTFIANLGDRGNPDKDLFWVRYKAKNKFGAYVSENMACTRGGSQNEWRRSAVHELIAVEAEYHKLLQAAIDAGSNESSSLIKEEARQTVLSSPDDLSR